MMEGTRRGSGATYIGMSSDLLNDSVIKMARITQEIAGNIVCMLDALKYISSDRELGSLSKLSPLGLALGVDVLHPAVVVRGSSLGDVLLEDDNIGIRDFNRVGRGEERSNTLMDGLCAEGWCCRRSGSEER